MLPYVSRDVATEPPTTVVIVSSNGPPADMTIFDETVFAITEDCIEPTVGWFNREGKPSLTICFMHSFGKCAGRMNSDPQTCFQIHVKPNVLNALRHQYVNPARKYFIRTVKAQLNPELRQQLSERANKSLKVQYLEFRVQDVFPSAGLIQYEATYRNWLFSSEKWSESTSTMSIHLCTNFSLNNYCEHGNACTSIHANLRNAQVRDPALAQALREFSPSVNGDSWRVNGAEPNPDFTKNLLNSTGTPIPLFTILPSNNGFTLAPVQSTNIPHMTPTSAVHTHNHPGDPSKHATGPPINKEPHKKMNNGENGWSSSEGFSSNGGLSSNTKSSSGSGSD